jgi:hypothetical protein
MVRSKPETIREAMVQLQQVLGRERAQAAAHRTPFLLRVTCIREAMAALVEVMGHEPAARAVERNAYILTARPETIRDAMPALVSSLYSI